MRDPVLRSGSCVVSKTSPPSASLHILSPLSWRAGYQKYGASKLEDGNRTRVVFPNSAILLRSATSLFLFLFLSLFLGIRRSTAKTRNNEWLPNFHGSKFCGHRSLLTRTVPPPHGIFIRDFWIVVRPF